MPTRNEARKALNKAKLPQRDKYVYRALLDVADNKTLEIPDRFQPYRQSDRYLFGTSRRTAQRALADLRRHGWISWTRKQKVRQRGQWPNHYTLSVGRDCDCPKERQDSTSDRAPALALNNGELSASLGAAKSARQVGIPAGQSPVLPKGVRDRGEVGEGSLSVDEEWARAGRARFAGLQWNDDPGNSEGEYANRSNR